MSVFGLNVMTNTTRRHVSENNGVRFHITVSRGCIAMALLLALVGIFYRFAALDRKIFWHDEVYTAIYLSGYKTGTVLGSLTSGQPVDRNQVLVYQRLHPERTLGDALQSLRDHDPHHPPLYYAALWVWARLFGASTWWLRAFSALCGVLALPAFAWWCRELFDSRRALWIGLALMAVSPFHVLYSQEARPYSIWALATCVSCAALLRAQRTQKTRDWSLYCLSLLFGLWTHLLFGLVVVAHILWMVSTSNRTADARDDHRVLDAAASREKLLKKKRFAFCLCAAFVLYTPFLISLLQGRQTAQEHLAWVTHGTGIAGRVQSWTANFGVAFFDPRSQIWQAFASRFIVAVFAMGALVWTIRRAPRPTAMFVASLFLCSLLPFVLLDVRYGGKSSQVVRFLVPAILALQLAAVFLIVQLSEMARWRNLSLALMFVLISGGLVSCEASRRSSAWWIKADPARIPDAVRLANGSASPLFIVNKNTINLGYFMALTRALPPQSRTLLLTRETEPIPIGFANFYVFAPSFTLQHALQASGYSLRLLDPSGWNEIISTSHRALKVATAAQTSP